LVFIRLVVESGNNDFAAREQAKPRLFGDNVIEYCSCIVRLLCFRCWDDQWSEASKRKQSVWRQAFCGSG
jgi:hypothetical protein